MKAGRFSYVAPASVEECVALLADHEDTAKVMAGGQSLVPMLNMRLAVPEVVIDISRIDELRGVRQLAGGWAYGAAITHSAFEDEAVPDGTRGLLAHAAAGIGYRAIRNRGTMGGSLSHADASAEWPVVLAALDAQLTCRSARGSRTIPARDFVLGFFTNALEDNELLTEIQVPALAPERRWGMYKAARKPGEFAESIGVLTVGLEGGVVRDVDAWLGGAADTPYAVHTISDALVGRPLDQAVKGDVVAAVEAGLPEGRSDEERYRAHLHAITLWRALREVRTAA